MARTLRDANLGTREARLRLKVRPKPYYRLLEPGLHLGYRRLANRPGTWCLRRYAGAQSYAVETLEAVADDYSEADGTSVLDFKQAQRRALASKPRPSSDALTVADAMRQYLEYLADHGKATYSDSKCRAEALIVPEDKLGDVAIEALTAAQIRAWHAGLAKARGRHTQHDDGSGEAQRRRQVTANRTLVILRAALNLAFREGHVPSDAAWRRVRPFRNVDTARQRHLSVAEAQRLMNAADADFRRLVQAALVTGMRYGELRALRVADYSADSNSVRVRKSKSGKSRYVALTDEGAALFQRWCAGRTSGEVLLTYNGEPWGVADQARPMLLACKRANIQPAANFHALRHTHATLAVKAGMPLLVLAKNLGHRDSRMVELHYGHLAQSYIADVVRDTAPRFGLEPADTVVPHVRP